MGQSVASFFFFSYGIIGSKLMLVWDISLTSIYFTLCFILLLFMDLAIGGIVKVVFGLIK